MVASMAVSSSGQSLSSFLVPLENKNSCHSTRLTTFRDEIMSEKSLNTYHSRQRILSSGVGAKEKTLSLPPADSAAEVVEETNREETQWNQSLGFLLEAFALLSGTILRLTTLMENSADEGSAVRAAALFALRQLLELLPESELDSLFLLSMQRYSAPLSLSPFSSAAFMLKLLSPYFLSKEYVSEVGMSGRLLGEGTFGTVYTLNCRQGEFATKRIPREQQISLHEASSSSSSPSRLDDVLNEVRCLAALVGSAGPSYLDFGVEPSGLEYWIVMERGAMSLKQWRTDLASSLVPSSCLDFNNLLLLLLMYHEVMTIVQEVHRAGIIHFDLKCENFMLRAEPSLQMSVVGRMEGTRHRNIFLIDFGESLLLPTSLNSTSSSLSSSYLSSTSSIQRSRGTLPIQSPEMLAINASDTRNSSSFSSNSLAASDIWSTGCLLYELMTNSFLFADLPWPELYSLLCCSSSLSLTSSTEPEKLINLEYLELTLSAITPIGLSKEEYISSVSGPILSITRKTLSISPALRPSIGEIIAAVDDIIEPLSSSYTDILSQPLGSFPQNDFSSSHTTILTNYIARLSTLEVTKVDELVLMPRGALQIAPNIVILFGAHIPIRESIEAASDLFATSQLTASEIAEASLPHITEFMSQDALKGLMTSSRFTFTEWTSVANIQRNDLASSLEMNHHSYDSKKLYVFDIEPFYGGLDTDKFSVYRSVIILLISSMHVECVEFDVNLLWLVDKCTSH